MELKALIEERNALIAEMQSELDAAAKEKRALAADYDAKKEKAEQLNKLISEKREFDGIGGEPVPAAGGESKGEAEYRAFERYIRTGAIETRDDVNMAKSDNGAVIPSSIANKIIEKIVELSPIYAKATKYNIGGTLNIPYYDETTQAITMAYATEFNDLESTSGKLLSIQLTGFLAGALTKVSKSLINNSQFDIVSYVVDKVAEAAVKWIENELMHGTANKITGLSGATQVVTTAASTAITADELIDLQDTVPDAFQGESIWVMSRATRTAIRKLKDNDGNYLLNKDVTSKWGYSLFGKPVYVSEKADNIGAGKTVVYYGDFSGLAVKTSENVSIDVLREKYATQHAVGVVAWLEMDAKIENQQKIAVLKMKAS